MKDDKRKKAIKILSMEIKRYQKEFEITEYIVVHFSPNSPNNFIIFDYEKIVENYKELRFVTPSLKIVLSNLKKKNPTFLSITRADFPTCFYQSITTAGLHCEKSDNTVAIYF